MPNERESVAATLNNLIAVCRGSEEGFRAAAEAVRSAPLKTLFGTFARERAQFAVELQDELLRLGQKQQASNSASPAFPGGWRDLEKALAFPAEAVLLEEAAKAEKEAIANYESALATPLPPDLRAIIARQHAEIVQSQQRLRTMERRAA